MAGKNPRTENSVLCSIPAGISVYSSPAEILLPAALLPYAFRMKERRGEWRDLIAWLLGRYSDRILCIARGSQRLRFQYQADGLGLRRVSYLPYRESLAELRMLSFAARVSMCALVVMMIEWEASGSHHKRTVVTMNFETVWTISGGVLTISAEILRSTHHPP